MNRVVRLLAIVAVVLTSAVVPGGVGALPSSAAVGTWTKITSPKGPGQPIYQYAHTITPGGTAPTMSVSGVTSSDVANVNIYCFTANNSRAGSPLNAAPVPVSAGAFSASGITAPGSALSPCILRAVPDTY